MTDDYASALIEAIEKMQDYEDKEGNEKMMVMMIDGNNTVVPM